MSFLSSGHCLTSDYIHPDLCIYRQSSQFQVLLLHLQGRWRKEFFKNVVLRTQSLIDYSKSTKVPRKDRILVLCPSRMALHLSCVPFSVTPYQNGSSRPLPITVWRDHLETSYYCEGGPVDQSRFLWGICTGASWTPNSNTVQGRAAWFVCCLTSHLSFHFL